MNALASKQNPVDLGATDAERARVVRQSVADRARRGIAVCCVGAAVLCILAVAAASWSRPRLNWDMLAYVAIVHSWIDAAPADGHAAAYADAARYASSLGLENRTAEFREGSYRETVAADPAAFAEQLPFYRIRPLYLLIVAAFAKLTATVSEATVLVAVLSFCAFSLALLWFSVRALGAVSGSIVGALFALAPTTTAVANMSTRTRC